MVTKKSFFDMVQDGLKYLSKNTPVTYFSDGSIAKALVETNCLEISRLQDYVATSFQNAFLSSATGVYLDMWGETLGLPRLKERRATALVEDGAVRFYILNGTLGSKLPHPTNPGLGLIPAGTIVSNLTDSVNYLTTEDVTFPVNSKSVYVSVSASGTGVGSNVGVNQLVVHNLNNTEVKVINDTAITTGRDVESDEEYRYRLTRAMTSRYGSNLAAIEVASILSPGVSRAEILQYARGAGTFDVLLIPQGNRVTTTTKENTRRALEQVSAYGISFQVREPEYVPIKITLQLSYIKGVTEAEKIVLSNEVESSILGYLAEIPLGGELIINQIRAASLVNSKIKDVKILELFIDCKPRTLRNYQLNEDELFVPDTDVPKAIEVV